MNSQILTHTSDNRNKSLNILYKYEYTQLWVIALCSNNSAIQTRHSNEVVYVLRGLEESKSSFIHLYKSSILASTTFIIFWLAPVCEVCVRLCVWACSIWANAMCSFCLSTFILFIFCSLSCSFAQKNRRVIIWKPLSYDTQLSKASSFDKT